MPADHPSTSANVAGEPASGPALDVSAWTGFFWEKRGVFVIAGVVGAAVGLVVSTVTLPKMYTATATVMVQDPIPLMPDQNLQASRDVYAAPEALKSAEGAFNTDSLLLRVVKNNHLDKTSVAFQRQPGQPAVTDSDLVERMSHRYTAKLQRASRLLDISVDDEDPEQAAVLAQSAVDCYIVLSYEQAGHGNVMADDQLRRQADEIRGQLQAVEQRLQSYREQYGSTSMEDRKDTTTFQTRQTAQDLAAARTNRIKLESDLAGLTDLERVPLVRLLASTGVVTQPDVVQLQHSLADAEALFAQTRNNYGPRHPQYLAAKGQAEAARSTLERVARDHARSLLNALESARTAENKLGSALDDQERAAVEVSGIAINFLVLQREVAADQTLYDQILQKIRMSGVEQNVVRTNIRQVQAPVPRNIDKPNKPKKPLVLAVTMIGAMAVAFLRVLWQKVRDTSFRTVEEAENALQLPMLAAVPRVGRARRYGRDRALPLIQSEDPRSVQAESFRRMRTSVNLQEGGVRTLLVTSSVPKEGKSFCAANYAVALAQQGLQVVLIDADLRRPSLGSWFAEIAGRKGFGDYLTGRARPDEICHVSHVPNLSVVPAGTHRARPAELLSDPRAFADLLKSLEAFDRVVIDSPPVLAVSDTILMLPQVDAVAFVVRARQTQQKELVRALHALDHASAQIVGFVLNSLPPRAAYSYPEYVGSYGLDRSPPEPSIPAAAARRP